MFVQSRGCCALLHSFSRSFRHNGLLDVRKVKYKVSYCVARSHILSLAKISFTISPHITILSYLLLVKSTTTRQPQI